MRADSPQAVSGRPCCAVVWRRTAWSEHGMGMAWSEHGMGMPWHGMGMAWVWHGHGMESVNQTRPRCVNQIGKTHSKLLETRHGRVTAWLRHGQGMICVNRPL